MARPMGLYIHLMQTPAIEDEFLRVSRSDSMDTFPHIISLQWRHTVALDRRILHMHWAAAGMLSIDYSDLSR